MQHFFLTGASVLQKDKDLDLYRDLIGELAKRYYYVPEMALQKINEIYLLDKFTPHSLGKLLDIGGGDGFVSHAILANKKTDAAVNVDLFVQQTNFYDFSIKEDISSTILRDGVFDNAISVCTLEHIPQIEYVLGVVSKKLKKGGGLFFTTPVYDYTRFLFLSRVSRCFKIGTVAEAYSRFHIRNSFHVSLLTQQQWEEILKKNGFRIVDVIPFFDSFEFAMFDMLNTWSRLPSSFHFWDKLYSFAVKYEIFRKVLIQQLKDYLVKIKSYKKDKKEFSHKLYIACKQ